jgi:hypothetical protein
VRTQGHNSCSAEQAKKQRTQFLLSEFQNQDQSTSLLGLASSLMDEDQMLQPCRAGLGRNFPLINHLISGNKKYVILPPTKFHSAKIRCALSIDRQSRDGCSERLGMRMRAQGCASCDNSPFCEDCSRACPRRSELQESLLNVHKTPMAADLYHHACIHQDLAIPPH